MSARPIFAREYGFWPTPTCGDSKNAANATATRHNPDSKHHHGVTLTDAIRMWPTPCARDPFPPHKPEYIAAKKAEGHGMSNLNDAVSQFPTPTKRDHKGGANWSNRQRQGKPRPESDMTLYDVVEKAGGSLNPTWVEWLIHWPIGWTSLEALNEREFQYWQASSTTHDRCSFVREMWFNREAGAPPQGSQPDEQRTGECGCALFAMPSRRAQATGDGSMRDLRDDVSAEAGEEVCAVREFDLQQGTRQAISRVAMGISARVDRLKAIGNGQVPLCAATAFTLLADG
jgi:hypothetical protein